MGVSAHDTEYVNSTLEPEVMGWRSSDVKLTWMICRHKAVNVPGCVLGLHKSASKFSLLKNSGIWAYVVTCKCDATKTLWCLSQVVTGRSAHPPMHAYVKLLLGPTKLTSGFGGEKCFTWLGPCALASLSSAKRDNEYVNVVMRSV